MFKTFIFTGGEGDPFALQGTDAADAVQSVLPGIAGYVQTRALGEESVYSGCAELYFYSSKAALAAESTDLSALLNNDVEATVSGLQRTVMAVPTFSGTEYMKGVYPFYRKAGMTVTDFQKHWWFTHGPIAALTEDALAYFQTHPMTSSYESGSPGFDGVTEIYWPDMAKAEAAVVSRQMVEDQANDAANFVDLERVGLFFGAEEVILAA